MLVLAGEVTTVGRQRAVVVVPAGVCACGSIDWWWVLEPGVRCNEGYEKRKWE